MKGPVTFDQRALLLAHQGNPEVRKQIQIVPGQMPGVSRLGLILF